MIWIFAGLTIPFLGVCRSFPLYSNIWPILSHIRVKLEPLLKVRLCIGLNCLSRAFWFANAAINAFIWMNNEHVLAFIEAIHRTDFHAVHILTLDTIFRDQISHKRNSPAIAALASVFAARMQGVTIKAYSSY